MFEIEGSHIAKLNDTDLRTLIVRLCEAELRQAGLPLSAVTAGGNQDAKDGGVDVRVQLTSTNPKTDFILCPNTVFQSKASEMPRGKILKEMRPKGEARNVLYELAKVGGAYIIASSKDNTSDEPLENDRRKAMRDAVIDIPNAEILTLDFYDQSRLATWVRAHPGVVAWVREQIGEPFSGWQVYGDDWPKSDEPIEAEYLLDEQCRLHDGHSQEGGLSVEHGIQRIREILDKPKGVVRLVGLSGTGKTRLVQALFDARIGSNALPTELALYTDIADEPDPSPKNLMCHLINNRQRAILIVDNCLPETHRSLTTICAETHSTLSLISVEYDVGEDEPEKTEVYRLEPSTHELIERLLEQRMPQTSQVDRRRMAELSGGNAKLALALANTVKQGESVAKLTDNELFKRLFHQGKDKDENLLKAAEVCSLVYSFDGETLQGEEGELPLLANLAGMTTDQLFGYVAELKRRQLVQCRGQWRAVLPQALAIWLARRALEDFPLLRIEETIWQVSSGRLLRSFSRRLGYLHDSEEAQKIVRGWLSPQGCLENIGQLTQLGVDMLRNIAPVLPEFILERLEHLIIYDNAVDLSNMYSVGRGTWIYILKSLAYEPKHFDRAAIMLAKLVIAEPNGSNYNSARNSFKSLFQLRFSGTHANVEQRLRVVEKLLINDNSTSQELAMETLNTLLIVARIAAHFSGSSDYSFGARSRNYGWQPSNPTEFIHWYWEVIMFCQNLALSDALHSTRVRSILAVQFRWLWIKTGMYDELEAMAMVLNEQQFWAEGWLAVRNTIYYHDRTNPSQSLSRLRDLEKALHPVNLLQNAHAYLSSEMWNDIAINDEVMEQGVDVEFKFEEKSINKTHNITINLGKELATQPDLLDELLPMLVHCKSYRCVEFGRGLALGADSLADIWERLIQAFVATPDTEKNESVLGGFISGAKERDALIADDFLDYILNHPSLGAYFPYLQLSIEIDEIGVERLKSCIMLGIASASSYWALQYNKSPIDASAISQIISGIASLPDGMNTAIDILQKHLHSVKSACNPIHPELLQCGRVLLCQYNFDNNGSSESCGLAELINDCLQGDTAALEAKIICQNFTKAIIESPNSIAYEYGEVLEGLFRMQPQVALDEFLTGETHNLWSWFLHDMEPNFGNPLKSVPIESLLSWVQVEPNIRIPKLAAVIPIWQKQDASSNMEWTAIALKLLELAPDKSLVLAEYQQQFWPSCWSGSLADILENYRALPISLLNHPHPEVATWARKQDDALAQEADERRVEERERERQRDERFE